MTQRPSFPSHCDVPNAELEGLLAAERDRDAGRAQAHAAEAVRYGGVAWSGFAPEPFRPRSEAAMRSAASAALGRRRAWRGSAAGQILGAVSSVQRAAEAAHAAAEALRASINRNAEDGLGHCARDAREIVVQAQALRDAADAAMQVLAQAQR